MEFKGVHFPDLNEDKNILITFTKSVEMGRFKLNAIRNLFDTM